MLVFGNIKLMTEEDYTDLEYANIITQVDPLFFEQHQTVRLTNLELYASKQACARTGLPLSELMRTPQYDRFIEDVNTKYDSLKHD